MLVSDLPTAQADAVSLGALPGIGKRELSDPKALDRIAASLTSST
jgi:two-component system chemotaxis response regulator CheY